RFTFRTILGTRSANIVIALSASLVAVAAEHIARTISTTEWCWRRAISAKFWKPKFNIESDAKSSSPSSF
uniref:Uncharacterized protein n=1 Tax=Romanomermis culicivorax TaxID=13658 RepID=A0A915HVT4_ROMCU